MVDEAAQDNGDVSGIAKHVFRQVLYHDADLLRER